MKNHGQPGVNFLKKHVCKNQRKATIDLGCWDVDFNKFERLWPFYHSSKYKCLYKSYRQHWYSGETYVYEGHKWIADQTYSFEPSFKQCNELPHDAVPVTVCESETGWHVPIRHKTIYKPPEPRPFYNFMTFLQSQPEHVYQYYHCLQFKPPKCIPSDDDTNEDEHFGDENSEMRLYNCLKNEEFHNNKLFIATDGGAYETKGKGSTGFLITNSSDHPFITCYGQPDGYEPKSYRSEICAALAALRLLRIYIEYYDLRLGNNILSTNINMHVYTDSESMIIKLNKMKEYPTAKHKMTLHLEWDVLIALHNKLKSFPKRPTLEWVESHQDDFEEE